jgi:copper chaperone CopZ
VRSVEADMNVHTMTVEFDDEDLSLEAIISALNDAGYTVPDRSKLQ